MHIPLNFRACVQFDKHEFASKLLLKVTMINDQTAEVTNVPSDLIVFKLGMRKVFLFSFDEGDLPWSKFH